VSLSSRLILSFFTIKFLQPVQKEPIVQFKIGPSKNCDENTNVTA
jgi:hypothetical protein